jgi:ubiquinone/menaquinone biosynthesis C-methylase UbiE
MAHGDVWKGESLTRTFLEGVRGGIPLAAEQIDAMLRVVGARNAAVERFADLGCGDGVLSRAVLDRYPNARATLVDFSEPMVEAARGKLGTYEPSPRLIVADLGNAHWLQSLGDESSFDLAVSGYAIHHLPDVRKRALYAEIFSLLGKGGMFVNIEHVASRTAWIESISDELMIDSLFAFHASRDSPKTRERVAHEFVHRPDKADNILAPVEDQCKWLREIGFVDVDCYFKVFELAVFGGRRP